jgi:hypothetical protein
MKKLFSIGNRKLGKDTMIFNLTSATDCPSKKKGLCKVGSACYAMKAERRYKNTLPYRTRQQEFWKQGSVNQFIKQFTLEKTKNIKYLRINEAGDFISQKDIERLDKIAKKIKELYGIKTYTYSARKDLDFSNVSFVINGSSWMADNEFRYIPKNKIYTGKFICPGDCKICNLCKEKRGIVIGVNHH